MSWWVHPHPHRRGSFHPHASYWKVFPSWSELIRRRHCECLFRTRGKKNVLNEKRVFIIFVNQVFFIFTGSYLLVFSTEIIFLYQRKQLAFFCSLNMLQMQNIYRQWVTLWTKCYLATVANAQQIGGHWSSFIICLTLLV